MRVIRFIKRRKLCVLVGLALAAVAFFGGTAAASADSGSPWIFNMSNSHADGLVIHGTSGTNNPFIVYDRLGQPIMAVAEAGGLKVFGDCVDVNAGNDVFNSQMYACPFDPIPALCVRDGQTWLGGSTGHLWRCNGVTRKWVLAA